MQKSTFWLVLLAAAVFLPLAARAVTVTENVTLILPSDSTSYTLAPSSFGTLTINNSSFGFDLAGGSQVNLSFAGQKTFTTSGGSSFSSAMQITKACGSSESTLIIRVTAGAGSDTVTVTPSGTCSSTSAGGGGGPVSTGGGGGGGSSAPFVPAQVAQAPTPPPSPAPAAAGFKSFASDLELGMSGDDVSRLQALLASNKEIYPEGLVTGYFGSLTRAAVIRFQAKYGLAQVGRVGPQTRAKLEEVFGKATPAAPEVAKPSGVAVAVSPVFSSGLALGSRSDDVKRLQQLLNSDLDTKVADSGPGSSGNESNYFGALTRRAVEKFQEKYGVAKAGEAGYGYVGPKTRAKLQEVFGGVPAPAPVPVAPTPAPVPVPAPSPQPAEELPWFLKLTPVTPAQ